MFSQMKIHSYFITREQFESFKPLKRLSNTMSGERTWILLYPAGLWLGEVGIKERQSGCQIQLRTKRRDHQRLSNVAPDWEILGKPLRTVTKDYSPEKVGMFIRQKAVAAIFYCLNPFSAIQTE